jgi:endonuclease G
MKLSNYYKNRFWSSFWVIVLLILAIFIVQNKTGITQWLGEKLDFELVGPNNEQKQFAVINKIPLDLIPEEQFDSELIHKPNYIVYYDEGLKNARYTLHVLVDTSTRGEASRWGIRFNERERIVSNTAAYSDFNNSGYDRGHLVPAGDFQCCQQLLEETFAMSNIAPFDSVLNRYAWNELEMFTRKIARRFGKVIVLTGPVFNGKYELGKYNNVEIPSHFFKILAISDRKSNEIVRISAFLLPNEAVYTFDKNKFVVTIDRIEELTNLDFFKNVAPQKENELESRIDVLN